MSDAESGSRNDNPTLTDVPVDWEALEDAFENNAPEVHSYLHVSTGEVLRVVDGIADPEMHTRIASDPNYMRVDPVSSREQYRWMERFIPMVDDAELKNRLAQAIDGKGAFRRFKDVLMAHAPERERWFAFRSERLRVFMEAWLTAHALKPIARVAAPAEGDPAPKTAGISQEQLSGRRVRGAEGLRRQLRELAESMGAREFVKARRAARNYGTRPEATSAASAPDGDVGADDANDEEPSPSSRRRTAARL
jgi:hypothetical protein